MPCDYGALLKSNFVFCNIYLMEQITSVLHYSPIQKLLPKGTSAMRLRDLIVRPSNSAIRCLKLGNAASILVPKTSRLTSRSSCAPDHEVKSLLVYGIQLAPQTKPIPLVNLQ